MSLGIEIAGSQRRRRLELEPSELATDKLSGVPEIAEFIGESERRTYYLLDRKLIPAGKLGSFWVASKKVLRDHYARLTGATAE